MLKFIAKLGSLFTNKQMMWAGIVIGLIALVGMTLA